jgi:hypothetical protein
MARPVHRHKGVNGNRKMLTDILAAGEFSCLRMAIAAEAFGNGAAARDLGQRSPQPPGSGSSHCERTASGSRRSSGQRLPKLPWLTNPPNRAGPFENFAFATPGANTTPSQRRRKAGQAATLKTPVILCLLRELRGRNRPATAGHARQTLGYFLLFPGSAQAIRGLGGALQK